MQVTCYDYTRNVRLYNQLTVIAPGIIVQPLGRSSVICQFILNIREQIYNIPILRFAAFISLRS